LYCYPVGKELELTVGIEESRDPERAFRNMHEFCSLLSVHGNRAERLVLVVRGRLDGVAGKEIPHSEQNRSTTSTAATDDLKILIVIRVGFNRHLDRSSSLIIERSGNLYQSNHGPERVSPENWVT
jgi:hypothetical protein